jgi:hypothetical protein
MIESSTMRPMVALSCALMLVACGGAASTPPAEPPQNPAPSASSPPGAAPAPGPASAAPSPSVSATAAADPPYEDPEEKDPRTLTPLFDKKSKPTFPKASGSEKDCWQTLAITGNASRDFNSLVAPCGTPTGAVEYVKPASGRLHHVKDQRDTFVVKVAGGLCYRFFGVADGSIKNLDILILKGKDDLVGQDTTTGPVAIIDSDKAWCIDLDGDYQFRVEVGGAGMGHYFFGVWARPKSKT